MPFVHYQFWERLRRKYLLHFGKVVDNHDLARRNVLKKVRLTSEQQLMAALLSHALGLVKRLFQGQVAHSWHVLAKGLRALHDGLAVDHCDLNEAVSHQRIVLKCNYSVLIRLQIKCH